MSPVEETRSSIIPDIDSNRDESADPLSKNPVFNGIEPRIAHYLKKFGSTPENEIVEGLVTDIDEHDLDVCRQMLFEESKSVLAKSLPGEETIPEFAMKGRNQPGKNISYAKDVVNLGLYLCELKSEYPHDLLSKSGTYLALVNRDRRSKSVSDINRVGLSQAPSTSTDDRGPKNVMKCDECDVIKVEINQLKQAFDVVKNEVCVKKCDECDVLKIEISQLKHAFDLTKDECVKLKLDNAAQFAVFSDRLNKLENALKQAEPSDTKPENPAQQQKPPVQEKQTEAKDMPTSNLLGHPSGSVALSNVSATGVSTSGQTDNASVKSVYPEMLSESQLKNLNPEELLARAEQRDIAADAESQNDNSDDESSDSDDKKSILSISSDEVAYDSDSDEYDEVFCTHVDMGTSPKMLRYEFVGSPDKHDSHLTNIGKNQRDATEKNEWKNVKPRKSSRRKNPPADRNSKEQPRKRISQNERRKRAPSAPRKSTASQNGHLFEGNSAADSPSRNTKSCTLFLENIKKKDCPPKELADSIKQFAAKQGYQIRYARIFDNKNRNVVSCKIVVPEAQSEELIGQSSRVWPQNVTCRRWRESGPPSASDPPEPNYRKESRQHTNERKIQAPNKSDWIGRKMNKGKFTQPHNSSNSDWESEGEQGRTWFRRMIRYCYENNYRK